MQGKTDKRPRRRHEDQCGSFWRSSDRLPARRLGFPTTCCLVLNKRWHVVWRHPTPWLKGLLTQSCSQHPISDPLCALLTPSFPFHFGTSHPSLCHSCSCQLWPANNHLLTGRLWPPVTNKAVAQKRKRYSVCTGICISVLLIQHENPTLFFLENSLQIFFLLCTSRLLTLLPTVPLCFETQGQLQTAHTNTYTHTGKCEILLIHNSKDIPSYFLLLFQNHFTEKKVHPVLQTSLTGFRSTKGIYH